MMKNTTLDDIASVIGMSATLVLVAWFGGRHGHHLYVPEEPSEAHTLVRLVGMSAARRMSAQWGREHLNVPTLAVYEQHVNRRTIGRLFDRGFDSVEIAHICRISERRVQQICRELEAAGLIEIVVPKPLGKAPGKKALAKVPRKNALQKGAALFGADQSIEGAAA